MNRLFSLVLSFLLALLVPLQARAAGPKLSQEQREILVQVLLSDAELTEETHRRFWAPLVTSQEPGARQAVGELANRRNLILFAQRYQVEAWSCALESWAKEAVIRTSELNALEEEALQTVRDTNGSESRVRASFANTQQLLEAAARHGTLSTPAGEVELAAEFIVEKLESLNAVFTRGTALLNPDWAPK